MIRRLQITLLSLFVGVWAMAAGTSVKNADGVEIWYNFDSSAKTASVTYKGESYFSNKDRYIGNVVIPSKVTYEGEEYSVTEIGDWAFSSCSFLKSITIPESVTEIGEDAFRDCNSLTSINVALDNNSYTSINGVLFSKDKTILIKYPEGKKDVTSYAIPESVTEIGNFAFHFCFSLTSITIPEGVTEIGEWAFSGCYKLYEVYNKSNLTITAGSFDNGYVADYAKNVYTDESGESKLHTVGDYIFYVDEDNIELLAYIGDKIAVTLPSDYEGQDYTIANHAFRDCSSLTSITIPEGVTEIGNSAFSGCSSLTSIDVALDNNSYTSINGVLFSKDKTILIKYPEGKKDVTSYAIPEGVTEIESYAFESCSSLTSITIPESVTEIGNFAFYLCSSLTSITSMNVMPPSFEYYTFYGVDKSIPVYVPKLSVEAYKSDVYWKDFTNIQGIDDNHLSLTLLLIVSLSVLLAIILLLKVRRAKRWSVSR